MALNDPEWILSRMVPKKARVSGDSGVGSALTWWVENIFLM